MQNDILGEIFRNLLSATPSIVVFSLGIIFSLVQIRKTPKGAIIVVISLIILGLTSIAQPFVFAAIRRMEDPATNFFVAGLLLRILSLAGVAGLIFAVFCDRETPSPRGNPYAKDFASFPPQAPPSFPGPVPLPPLGGSLRPPQ